MSRRILFVLALPLLLTAQAPAPSTANCRDDLIKADQGIHRTRSALHKAQGAAPAVQCTAYRQHVASLNVVKNVFARCDAGANKAKNAATTGAAIAELSKQMQGVCGTAQKAAPKKQP